MRRASPFEIDLRSLALFRIGLALLLLANLASRARDLEAHFTDFGVLPRAELRALQEPGALLLSLHALGGGSALQVCLFLASSAFALALGLGFRTRVATFASWLLLVSLQNRNPLVLTGGDDLMRLLLFWSCFLPLGALASLDARRRPPAAPPALRLVSLPGAILLLQIALLYPVSALFKLREPAWQSLDALTLAMSVDGAATALGQHLVVTPALDRALTAGALGFELLAPLLAFLPFAPGRLRLYVVALFLAYHAGLALLFRFGLFPLVCAVAWSVFLPSRFWELLGQPAAAERLPPSRWQPWRDGLALALAAAVLIHVAATLGWIDGDERGARGITRKLVWTLRLDQHWSLWSDPPSNRYFVAAARTGDGRSIDLRRDGAPLDWSHPAWRSRNSHWWKLELSLSHPSLRAFGRPYGCYLVRDWNRRSAERDRVESAVGWMLTGSRSEVESGNGTRALLWEVDRARCGGRL